MRILNDYDIDEWGNVYSYISNKYLKPYLDKDGYLCITIHSKHYKIHRLVGENYLNNPYDKPCIDHIDRNKLNNHYSNLRYVTPKENSNNINTINHLRNIGKRYKTEYGKPIVDKNGKIFPRIIEASKQSKVSRSVIQYHLKNKTGEWKYVQKV